MFESNLERKIEETLRRDSEGIVLIPNPKTHENEEWIWVEGYKGTNKDMSCRGMTYELGKQYDMPDDVEIEECENGYHLCMALKDVFKYYGICAGNRFFKVRALVRKHLVDNYGKTTTKTYKRTDFMFGFPCFPHGVNTNGDYVIETTIDKLAAKSIEFIRELTIDEILADTEAAELPEKYKKMAIEESVPSAIRGYENECNIYKLVELGYSNPFADYIVNRGLFKDAYAVGTQKDLSMDMKALMILKGNHG